MRRRSSTGDIPSSCPRVPGVRRDEATDEVHHVLAVRFDGEIGAYTAMSLLRSSGQLLLVTQQGVESVDNPAVFVRVEIGESSSKERPRGIRQAAGHE